ncbi:MAG TPA: hypothetical protein VJZ94_02350, partial [Candidatus Paceibacterota bacterium]|nr:hypothetical protein [Candidatus Paceibacterota bacterium]
QTARDRYVATLLGAEITVEVDTLGALLHGLDLLELITFCWDYKISLIVTGKIDLFRDGVIALLQREKAMLPATATGLFGALFSECRPGSGPPILYLNAFKPPKAPT